MSKTISATNVFVAPVFNDAAANNLTYFSDHGYGFPPQN